MKFSSKKAKDNFPKMLATTQWLATEMSEWAKLQGVEITFTETWSSAADDKALKRTSDTHRTGRAFDIRTKDLTPEFIEQFQIHFNTLYNDTMGAVNSQGPCLIFYKPHGTGPHFHVQIRRGYDPKKTKA